MKKLVLLSVLFGALPISMMAQDDLYFTPKKSDKTVKSTPTPKVESEAPTYYSGSNRNIDEYNRRGKFGSYFEKIGTDSLGNDIIEFHSSAEDVTDTLAVYPGTKVEYDRRFLLVRPMVPRTLLRLAFTLVVQPLGMVRPLVLQLWL